MAQVINTNSISLLAQNNLNKSQSALGTAIERLSSGLRINSAKDDAAGEAIANRFTSNINGLTQASRNANDGISLAQTTEGALDEVNDNLQAIRTLTVQAQTGTNSASDLQSIQDEVTQRLAEVDRISQQTDFNGVKVLSADKSLSVQVGADDGQTISINLQQVDAKTLGLGTFNVNGAQGQTNTVKTATTATPAILAQTATTDVTSATLTNTLTTIAGASTLPATNTVADITSFKDADGNSLSGTLVKGSDGNAYLEVAGSGDNVTMYKADSISADGTTVTVGEKTAGTIDTTTTAFTPTPPAGTVTGLTAVATGTTVSLGESVTNGSTTTSNQSSAATAATLTFKDASGNTITGGSLVKGDDGNYYVQTDDALYSAASISSDGSTITVGNETKGTTDTGTFTPDDAATKINNTAVTSISITDASGKDMSGDTLVQDSKGNYFVQDSKGMSYAATVTVGDDGTLTASVDSSKAIAGPATNDALATLDKALSDVDTMRSNLGAIQNRLDSTIDNLSSTTTNLSEAQSRIQDADYATEVSNMSKAQILQQAGTSVLAQANQVPQTVLSLLK
ncbi:flagellin [Sodalis ligni]|uniref:Flagellin n=1 Tax=Sodalis ligni TaxID=2697027 RepID=A0A4R1NCI0_9GAMM|nr:flagellin [Sodalis ligni]TCL02286.1 flagellin [Sodalis ligni]